MAPPKAGSLTGCSIAFAGAPGKDHSIFVKSVAELRKLLGSHGATFMVNINETTTHLCANPSQVTKPTAKVKEAKDYPDIKLVDFNWLSTSLTSKSKIDEASYILRGSGTDTAGAATGSVKNSAIGMSNGTTASAPASTPSKKRSRPTEDEEDSGDVIDTIPPKKAKEKETGKAKSLSLNIPLDKGVPPNYKVYIGDDATIYDVTLNQTNAGQNNNKFYRIQLLVDSDMFMTWTRWGRVNEGGQSKLLGDGSWQRALWEFQKKFKDKNGNAWENRDGPVKSGKYTLLELSYEDSSDKKDDELPRAGKRRASKESLESTPSDPVESKLPGPVQSLMKLIFNQQYFNDTMADFDYDVNKMPLGKLSKRTLLKGYEVLKELATLVADTNQTPVGGQTWAEAVESRSNNYFSVIPHAFGRNRPPVLSNTVAIKKEIELLEALTDMQLANDIMKDAKSKSQAAEQVNLMDRQFQGLGMQEVTPLVPGGSEFKELADYLVKSAGTSHGIRYQVQDIFRIERQGEHDRFRQSKYSKIPNSDRRLLWHGSRCTNFGGILSQGLRIAPAESPVSGYMFGKGVYLADISTKSANYCNVHSSGNIGLLLLCEAELGKPPLKLINADYQAGERAEKESRLSTWGVGSTAPKHWKDASCVNKNLEGVLMPDISIEPGPSGEQADLLYNEYIVYDVAQIRLRYLFRVEMKYGW